MKTIKTTENKEYTIAPAGIPVRFRSLGKYYKRQLWEGTDGSKWVKFEGTFYRISIGFGRYEINDYRAEFAI